MTLPFPDLPLTTRLMALFMWPFSWLYGHWLVWRYLDGVYGQGIEQARETAASGPVLLALNHTCWWDGILMLMLHHWLGIRGRFLVASESTDGMSYLDSLGAIRVDRSSLSATADALQRAADWLDGPGRSVLLFPQGRFRPAHVRPLGLERGVQLLQRHSGATILPVSLSVVFVDTHRPRCLVTFGKPIEPGRRDVMQVLEDRLVEGLDAHMAWLDDLSRPEHYQAIVRSAVVPHERRLLSRVHAAGATLVSGLVRPFRRG